MDYIYKSKTFRSDKSLVKWLNEKGIEAGDIISITAHCESDTSYPSYTVFYKELI